MQDHLDQSLNRRLACSSNSTLLAACDYRLKHYQLDKVQKEFLKYGTFKGWEIVANTARMCLMSLFLHTIGALTSEPPAVRDDSLTDLENLPVPEVLAEEIVENLEAGLESFRQVLKELEG